MVFFTDQGIQIERKEIGNLLTRCRCSMGRRCLGRTAHAQAIPLRMCEQGASSAINESARNNGIEVK
jgi:hypothetical protein